MGLVELVDATLASNLDFSRCKGVRRFFGRRYPRLGETKGASSIGSLTCSGFSLATIKRTSTGLAVTSDKIERIKSRNRPSRCALAKVVGTRTTKTPSWKEIAAVPWNQVVKTAGETFDCTLSIVVCQICFAFKCYYLSGNLT